MNALFSGSIQVSGPTYAFLYREPWVFFKAECVFCSRVMTSGVEQKWAKSEEAA